MRENNEHIESVVGVLVNNLDKLAGNSGESLVAVLKDSENLKNFDLILNSLFGFLSHGSNMSAYLTVLNAYPHKVTRQSMLRVYTEAIKNASTQSDGNFKLLDNVIRLYLSQPEPVGFLTERVLINYQTKFGGSEELFLKFNEYLLDQKHNTVMEIKRYNDFLHEVLTNQYYDYLRSSQSSFYSNVFTQLHNKYEPRVSNLILQKEFNHMFRYLIHGRFWSFRR
jgi:hypothetical protein